MAFILGCLTQHARGQAPLLQKNYWRVRANYWRLLRLFWRQEKLLASKSNLLADKHQ
jgi:hypothetical protein